MRMVWAASMVALGLLAAPAARADELQDAFLLRNTGDLVTLCTAPAESPRYATAAAFCQGFAVGVYRTAIEVDAGLAARRGAGGRRLFCPSADGTPSRTEAVMEFVAWTRTHPDSLARPAIDGVSRFMAERFACPASAGASARR